jgi:hypothetical protein
MFIICYIIDADGVREEVKEVVSRRVPLKVGHIALGIVLIPCWLVIAVGYILYWVGSITLLKEKAEVVPQLPSDEREHWIPFDYDNLIKADPTTLPTVLLKEMVLYDRARGGLGVDTPHGIEFGKRMIKQMEEE